MKFTVKTKGATDTVYVDPTELFKFLDQLTSITGDDVVIKAGKTTVKVEFEEG